MRIFVLYIKLWLGNSTDLGKSTLGGAIIPKQKMKVIFGRHFHFQSSHVCGQFVFQFSNIPTFR